MYNHETNIRVRYAETDQMKYAYYGVYAQYFEVARVELLRSLGISYKKIEELGFLLPVVHYTINYKLPAFYDDQLLIKTIIPELPNRKIIFNYETYNEDHELINEATTILVFKNLENKVCRSPSFIIDKLDPYY